MKCPKWLLDAMAEGKSVDCIVWNDESYKRRFRVSCFDVNAESQIFYSHGNGWWSHAEPYKEPEHEFKPFEQVLMRDTEGQTWECKIFNRKEGDLYSSICGGGYIQCIPYVGNEKLLGTTKTPEGQ